MANDSKPHAEYLRNVAGRNYYSQAGQDLFALDMTGGKSNGTYVEIGGAHPFESNNTFLLESNHGWNGFAVELDKSLAAEYNKQRQNECFNEDAILFGYKDMITEKFGNIDRVDYISIDIDPSENTYKALQNVPFEDFRFSVITYEHDNYSDGPTYMEKSRAFLEERGYQLVCANVMCFGRDFEDWWVDPNVISEEIWGKYKARNPEFAEIFS